MEFSEIETFIAVASAESFSRAAENLGYSQSAVTVHIKKLERELGVRLFDRLGKRISLTGQGQLFYEKAVQISNQMKSLKPAMMQPGEPDGLLRIGTIESLCSAIFPDIVNRFHSRFPLVKLDITTDTPDNLLDMLKNNRLDIIYILDERINLPWTAADLAEEERVVFAAGSGHPLAGKTCGIEELLTYPICLTEKDSNYRKVLESRLNDMNITIMPTFSSNNTDLLLNLIEHSDAVAFLPEYCVERLFGEGRLAPIEVDRPRISVYRQIIHHKDKWINPEMEAFLETAAPEKSKGENHA